MIKIAKEITTASIELLYRELRSQTKKTYVDLLLPRDPKFTGFGALAEFFQFMITWRRMPNCGQLIISTKEISTLTSDEVESLVKRYYGFIGSVLAWNKGIITKNGKDVKQKFRIHNAEFVKQLVDGSFDKTSRGDSILYPFFDHLDTKRGLLPIVYRDGILQDEKEFESLTDSLLETITKNNSLLKKSYASFKNSINAILYELFDNTNKWAKKSFTGRVLDPSVRGIYAKFYKLEYKNLKSYSSSIGIERYFKKIQAKNVRKDEPIKYVAFLELSIFDSGSGLVQQFSKTELSKLDLKEEYSILLECLKKHTTSHTEFGDFETRGLGLHRIVNLLDSKDGFLMIRSGRMSLYRDFITYPMYENSTSSPAYFLLDWNTHSTNPTDHSHAEGTLITILLPVTLKEKLATV